MTSYPPNHSPKPRNVQFKASDHHVETCEHLREALIHRFQALADALIALKLFSILPCPYSFKA